MKSSAPVLVKDIFDHLSGVAPLSLQASYDNSGIITGHLQDPVTGILICLDSTEKIIDEAIDLGINLVIAHHPIVFKGLKSITGKDYVERTIIKAIKNDITILAWHTNLDSVYENGVSSMIASQLELKDTKILKPEGSLHRIEIVGNAATLDDFQELLAKRNMTYHRGSMRLVMECSDQELQYWNPIFEKKKKEKNLQIFLSKEVALSQNTGYGIIGNLVKEMDKLDFLSYLKKKMKLEVIKYTKEGNNTVSKVALCGGAGSFLINSALSKNADVFITGDMKYHEFFDTENQCTMIDIGHYESEKYTIELLHSILIQKFSTFAIRKTVNDTNPIEYYYK